MCELAHEKMVLIEYAWGDTLRSVPIPHGLPRNYCVGTNWKNLFKSTTNVSVE